MISRNESAGKYLLNGKERQKGVVVFLQVRRDLFGRPIGGDGRDLERIRPIGIVGAGRDELHGHRSLTDGWHGFDDEMGLRNVEELGLGDESLDGFGVGGDLGDPFFLGRVIDPQFGENSGDNDILEFLFVFSEFLLVDAGIHDLVEAGGDSDHFLADVEMIRLRLVHEFLEGDGALRHLPEHSQMDVGRPPGSCPWTWEEGRSGDKSRNLQGRT